MSWSVASISPAAEAALRAKYADLQGLRAVSESTSGTAGSTEYCAVCCLSKDMVTVHYCEVSGGVVKEVTCGGAQRSDVDGSKEVGAWPLMGDAIFIPWVDQVVRDWFVSFSS
ncbi:unnamed protein product [Durusdinium trenchii]|uniref:Uncharacterized protein n=2 Tax=Durusdinium trenchii TaxID=1381693 RepID=A0ABP0JIT8_9DINO